MAENVELKNLSARNLSAKREAIESTHPYHDGKGKPMKPAIYLSLLLLGLDAAAGLAQEELGLHVVQAPIKSHRLLAMSMDDDGHIWTGSIHNVVHRYDPRTGTVEDVPLPCQAAASACLCVGHK